jgi:alanyl-tRNA synthetase
VLPRTTFYPEGGGQLGDAGQLSIGGTVVAVVDTQLDDRGLIHHVLASELPPELVERLREGSDDLVVKGTIDEARRRDHTVQHTAQHALSRALADEARAGTVSARLGASSCTIDVDRAGIADAELHRAEDLVNAVVMNDLVVEASFPTADELAQLELRKKPNAEKSAAGVRVVSIEGFDVTPCGGTHCSRTGQIGQIRIVGREKYKGMLRITFHAGTRALADARARHGVLAALASDLTCGALDVPAAVAKLRSDGKVMRERLEAARMELAELIAHRLREALPETPGPHVVHLARVKDDLATLRALAGELAKDPRVAALVGGHDEGSGEVLLVVQRGEGARLDCGAFVQTQARARGGRGGGRPERAEGRFPRGTSIEVLAAAARDAVGV